MPRLTDRQVRAAKPDTARVYELVDGDGLSLVVQPSGAKIWRLRYRNRNRERKRVVLGRFPDLSLAEARTEASKHRGDVARGVDPAADRQAAREALRMRDLLGVTDPSDPKRDTEPGWFLGTYCKTAGKLGRSKTVKSIATDRAYIAKHLRKRSRLMGQRVDEVTKTDIERVKAKMTPGAWRKVRDILGVCFRHCEAIGAIPRGTNPVVHVDAVATRKVERYLSPQERAKLAEVLAHVEQLGGSNKGVPRGEKGGVSRGIVRALRLLSLTGMRRGAVLAMRWEDIDWNLKHVRVGDKTGARVVPLTEQAATFLLRERGKADRTGLVCTTEQGTAIDPENVGRAWRRIRDEAGIPDVRLHDLRHSWASDAVSAGVPLQVIGYVLGHKSTQTTARYAHLHDTAIRDGLAKAGAAIEAAEQTPAEAAE